MAFNGQGRKEFHWPSHAPNQASSYQVPNQNGRTEIYSPRANVVLIRSIFVNPALTVCIVKM